MSAPERLPQGHRDVATPERKAEDEPGAEPSDVREPRHAARAAEGAGPADYLRDEPEPEEEDRGHGDRGGAL